MSSKKTLEELERENKELKAALERVMRAYEALGEAIKACPDISGNSSAAATAQSSPEVKKLLEKYSRL